MLSDQTIQEFRLSLRGPSFCPGDAGYDAARKVPNAMIDRHPAVIARCAGAADVIQCVRFAREYDILVAVRGGGHSVAGKSVCDGGLMIDLSAMKGIRVHPACLTVRAETGLTLGEFDAETQAFGMATTMGTVSATGIAGLTLGAGWGNLHSRFGLALDNVISADVVTADGLLLTANANENDELFWGIRGGGGNFGVVTSLEYRLHEVGRVLGGAVFYPVAKTKEVLHFFRDYAATIPDELVIQGGAMTVAGMGRVLGIAGCYSGELSKAEKVLRPLRSFGAPIADIFQPMSYVEMQKLFDPFFPPGRYTYTKSNFFREMSDGAIDTMASFADEAPSPHIFAPFLEHWHGAVGRVPATETAFPHRKHSFNFLIWSTWEDPSESERNIAWTRECWDRMRPFLVEDSYSNYVSDEGEAAARAAYGPNYDRLLGLKNRYDPTNLFRMNHNVKPTLAAAEISA